MSRQALIIVDVQHGFDDPSWGARNNPECEANIAKLLDRWELVGQPVVVVRHDSIEPQSPLRPDRPGNVLKDFLHDRGDVLISKSVHSAFHGEPDLDGWLRAHEVNEVVITGITTNHCCETTARMACDLGYQVCFVGDATATFDRTSPSGELISADRLVETTLTNLNEEFAEISDTYRLLQRVHAPASTQPE
jgi:nicotinamidase-related amidase